MHSSQQAQLNDAVQHGLSGLGPVVIRDLLVLVLPLIIPPVIISYVVATRYRQQVLGRFPILRGSVLQLTAVLWWIFAYFTFMRILLAAIVRP